MEKSYKKYTPKASLRPLFYFGKQPKTAITYKKLFLEYNLLKGDYQNPLKNLTLFFLSNLAPFNGQSYKKQKGIGTSEQSLFRLRNKFTKISLLVTYYQVIFNGVI